MSIYVVNIVCKDHASHQYNGVHIFLAETTGIYTAGVYTHVPCTGGR